MMEYRTIAAPVSASFVEKNRSSSHSFFRHAPRKRLWKQLKKCASSIAVQDIMSMLTCCVTEMPHAILMTVSRRELPECRSWMCCKKNGLTDVCCVVTRYFGGVLLGANGLVRAYSHSTALAIEAAQIKIMMPCYPVSIQTDYALYGKIAYHLPQEDILQLDTIFEDQVELKLLVRDTLWDKLKQELIDLTSGQVEIVSGGLQYADFSKAKRL